jgi:hypothetical protein
MNRREPEDRLLDTFDSLLRKRNRGSIQLNAKQHAGIRRRGQHRLHASAPVAAAMVNVKLLFDHASDPNEELLRPSSQVSICRAEMTGTWRRTAAPTIASDPACGALSVCIAAVNAP